MSRSRPEPDLRAHGLIGDRATAALVASDATIDWFCPRRFDEPAALFALIEPASGGRVTVGPPNAVATGQSYPDSGAPILRTRLAGPESLVDVHDVLDGGRIIRLVTALRGPADIEVDIVPGDRFGPPRKVQRWSEGVSFGALMVRGATTPTTLDTGESLVVTIDPLDERGVVRSGPEMSLPASDQVRRRHEELGRLWKSDLDEIDYDGPFAAAVRAAARAIRLATHAGTGAVISAVTTSLPALVGNERNVDQRYGWLRDNAAAVWLWERLGRPDWADETRAWLTERAAEELPLPPCTRVDGERLGSENELSLTGWRGGSPVRIGNAAADGLDLTGMSMASMVLDARRSWPTLERMGDWLSEHGGRPDHGRWDSRSRPQLWVASRLAVHAALQALVATSRARHPLDADLRGWTDAVAEAEQWLSTDGRFGVAPNAGWRRVPSDDSCDAATLPWAATLPTLKVDGPGDDRARLGATLDQMLAQLEEGPFVHRHLPHVDDGFPPGQGPDLTASFWMVSALAAADRWEQAHERMEALVSWVGPLVVLSTHVDIPTGDCRGNLASASAAIALISAAVDLRHGPS